MKKLFGKVLSVALLSSLVLTTACGESGAKDTVEDGTTKLVVGATAVPHAEILGLIKDDLLADGVDIEIKEFSDYTLINAATVDGSIDANFFQHTPFLNSFNDNSATKLVSVGPIHIEPLGLYSNKIIRLEDLKDGDKIAIPNDETNEARALLLLEDNGLIKVKDRTSTTITPIDIVENPLNLKFIELDAAQLPRTIDEVAASVINTNYALEAGFNPSLDAIIIEDGGNSPYANILVVVEGRENEEAIEKIYKAMTTEKVKKFIEENYGGAVIAAF